jgi:uncharacterized protein (TIGR02646 family)
VRPPSTLRADSKPAKDARWFAGEFFSRKPEERLQERHSFAPNVYGAEDVLAALNRLFNGKCAYCEMRISFDTPDTVDHFRPMFGALGLDGSFDPDHYFWLAYEWPNLYPACPECARNKGHRFPVAGRRAPLRADREELRGEGRLVIDPCEDEPERELVFLEDASVSAEGDRGRTSIELFGLNRPSLIAARKEVLATAQLKLRLLSGELRREGKTQLSRASVAKLRSLLDPAAEFAGMQRQFAARWARQHKARLDELLAQTPRVPDNVEQVSGAVPKVSKAQQKRAKASYEAFQQEQEEYSVARPRRRRGFFLTSRLIERVELTNFRNIRHLKFDVPSGKGGWQMFLGENGTGKSSILQAVALALVGASYRGRLARSSGLDPASMVRWGQEEASVRVWLNGIREPIELTFTNRSRVFQGRPREPKTLVLGYGATRLLPREARRQPAPDSPWFASVDNLFDPFTPLKDTERWLLRLHDDAFESVAGELKKLLPLDPQDRLERVPKVGRKPPAIQTTAFGTPVTLRQLSDGYQSVVALVTDIMQVLLSPWLSKKARKAQQITTEVVEGVVLIDELESHLHPRWKMQIVSSLRQVFPLVQFLVTTHDPLCLRGLRDQEVMVLRRLRGGDVFQVPDLPPVQALRVDQLLTSEHFGLNSTVDPETDALFEEYYRLRGSPDLTSDEQARLTQLQKDVDRLRAPGTSRQDRLIYQAIDEWTAQERVVVDAALRRELTKDTKKKIARIWASVPPRAPSRP